MRQIVLLIFALLTTGCGMKTGDEALALMSQEQKKTVDFILSLTPETSISDISAVLGKPSDLGVGGLNPSWHIEQNGATTMVRAYFLTNQLNKINYLSSKPMWGYVVYYDENGATPGT